MLIKSAIRPFLTKMAKKKKKNCENLLSCHFTFSMNTYKTLKSFSLTSTKMWVGGREGVTGGCRSERLCSGVLNPGFHVHLGIFFFFFLLLFGKKKKSKKFIWTAEIPNNIPQSCCAIVWIVPIFKTDELYVPTVRPVVAGEDRLRFAKSIFLDFNSLSRARPVKLQILHNYNIFYRDSINPVCSCITCKPIMHIALGDCWNYI